MSGDSEDARVQLHVSLHGCDDSTSVVIATSPRGEALLEELAALVEKESEYNCMPVMRIRRAQPYDFKEKP